MNYVDIVVFCAHAIPTIIGEFPQKPIYITHCFRGKELLIAEKNVSNIVYMWYIRTNVVE